MEVPHGGEEEGRERGGRRVSGGGSSLVLAGAREQAGYLSSGANGKMVQKTEKDEKTGQ